MFLSDTAIKKLLKEGSLTISPYPNEKDIRPHSVRVHLGAKLIQYDDQVVDPTQEIELSYKEIDLSNEPFILKPNAFVLGSTVESVRTPRHIFGFLDGRSTLARLGLTIHITAAVTDSLYDDARVITLEIHNASNMSIVLSHKMAIGALLFAELDQPVAQDAQKQYKGQQGPLPSNLKNQFS